jgi:hypothetical protein
VFAGAVVLDVVAADQLLTDRDLDAVTDHSYLNLTSPIGVTDSIVRPSTSPGRRVREVERRDQGR